MAGVTGYLKNLVGFDAASVTLLRLQVEIANGSGSGSGAMYIKQVRGAVGFKSPVNLRPVYK